MTKKNLLIKSDISLNKLFNKLFVLDLCRTFFLISFHYKLIIAQTQHKLTKDNEKINKGINKLQQRRSITRDRILPVHANSRISPWWSLTKISCYIGERGTPFYLSTTDSVHSMDTRRRGMVWKRAL